MHCHSAVVGWLSGARGMPIWSKKTHVAVLLLQRRGDPYVVKVFFDIAGSSNVPAKTQEFKIMQGFDHKNLVKFFAMEPEVRITDHDFRCILHSHQTPVMYYAYFMSFYVLIEILWFGKNYLESLSRYLCLINHIQNSSVTSHSNW